MLVRLREQMIRGRRRAVSNAKPPQLVPALGVDSEDLGFASDLSDTNPGDPKDLKTTTLGIDGRDSAAATLLGSD